MAHWWSLSIGNSHYMTETRHIPACNRGSQWRGREWPLLQGSCSENGNRMCLVQGHARGNHRWHSEHTFVINGGGVDRQAAWEVIPRAAGRFALMQHIRMQWLSCARGINLGSLQKSHGSTGACGWVYIPARVSLDLSCDLSACLWHIKLIHAYKLF